MEANRAVGQSLRPVPFLLRAVAYALVELVQLFAKVVEVGIVGLPLPSLRPQVALEIGHLHAMKSAPQASEGHLVVRIPHKAAHSAARVVDIQLFHPLDEVVKIARHAHGASADGRCCDIEGSGNGEGGPSLESERESRSC
jgi:hypothetical protein